MSMGLSKLFVKFLARHDNFEYFLYFSFIFPSPALILTQKSIFAMS
jgi:hypothetical protein